MAASVISPSAAARASVPAQAPALAADELDALAAVHQHFADRALVLPADGKHGPPTPLGERERFWLSRECFLRYLKSSKGDVRAAVGRIHTTLLWRREIGVDDIGADEVERENICGKTFLLGYSSAAEPLYYVTPSRRDTEPSETQFRHLVWVFEQACHLMGPGVDGVVVLLDFAGKSKRPSITLTTRVLAMMSSHYPCRIAAAFVQNTPFVLNAFLAVAWPLIDPATRDKVDMKGRAGTRVDRDVLVREWNGELDFEYVHDKYWPYLLQLAGAKRTAAFARWRAAGGLVGTSERAVRRWDDGVAEVGGVLSADGADPAEVDVKRAAGDVVDELDVPILV